MNFGLTVLRNPFRVFVHRPRDIATTLASEGFERVFQAIAGPARIWEMAVYQRR